MKAVLYARTEDEGKGTKASLDKQLAACRSTAEANDWEIVGEFTDVGDGATVHPGYRELIKAARHADVVVVEEMHTFGVSDLVQQHIRATGRRIEIVRNWDRVFRNFGKRDR